MNLQVTLAVAFVISISWIVAFSTGACPDRCICTELSDKTVETDCQRLGLTSIPDGVSNLTSILKLQGNKITSLTGRPLNSFNKLTDLYLNGNGLQTLGSDALSGLVALKRLYLSQNLLQQLPEVCRHAPRLQRLFVDENRLTDVVFPSSYTGCTELTSASVSGNHWSRVNSSIFASLKSREFSSLKMSSVSLQLIENSTFDDLSLLLRSLDLGGNSLDDRNLAEVFQATKFSNRFLSLSLRRNSRLTRLQSGFLPAGHFPRLGFLDLSENPRLAQIDSAALAGATYLTDVVLDGASLTRLNGSEFAGLARLNKLSLARTGLVGWATDSLDAVRHPVLRQIDIANCRVTTIGGADGRARNPLPALTRKDFVWLRAAGNPFHCNCDLRWLRLALAEDSVRKKIPDLAGWLCKAPVQLAGQPVANFTLPDDCSETTSTSTSQSEPGIMTPTSISSSSASSLYQTSSPSSSTAVQSDSTVTTLISSPQFFSNPTSFPFLEASQSVLVWLLPTLYAIGAVLLLVFLCLILFRQRKRLVLHRQCCSWLARDNSTEPTTLPTDSELIEA